MLNTFEIENLICICEWSFWLVYSLDGSLKRFYVSLKRKPPSISKPDKGNQLINYGGISNLYQRFKSLHDLIQYIKVGILFGKVSWVVTYCLRWFRPFYLPYRILSCHTWISDKWSAPSSPIFWFSFFLSPHICSSLKTLDSIRYQRWPYLIPQVSRDYYKQTPLEKQIPTKDLGSNTECKTENK